MKMNTNNPKLKGHSEGSPRREVHSNKGLPKKKPNKETNTKKPHFNLNKQPNPTPTGTQGTKPKTA